MLRPKTWERRKKQPKIPGQFFSVQMLRTTVLLILQSMKFPSGSNWRIPKSWGRLEGILDYVRQTIPSLQEHVKITAWYTRDSNIITVQVPCPLSWSFQKILPSKRNHSLFLSRKEAPNLACEGVNFPYSERIAEELINHSCDFFPRRPNSLLYCTPRTFFSFSPL